MSNNDDELGKTLGNVLAATTKLTWEIGELLFDAAKATSEGVIYLGKEAVNKIEDNQDEIASFGKEVMSQSQTFLASSISSSAQAGKNLISDMTISSEDVEKLQSEIQKQSKQYKKLCSKHTGLDTLMVGGETLVYLLETDSIPDQIITAYETAYPAMSETISFQDKVLELDEDQISGFIAGVKGKLFEMQYIDYLNAGQLPEGYNATLAESPTQEGWDIAISGPDGKTVDLLQAKATDSVSYVRDAIEENPNIEVVTTEEVYNHLLLSGAGDNVINSEIANSDLEASIEDAASSEISMDLTPPLFSLALIAFTSYSEEGLSLYEKTKAAGERSGKTYLSYLIGGGVAVLTNTWWLGLAGTVASRYFSDRGGEKVSLIEKLETVKEKNDHLIKRYLRARFQEELRNYSSTSNKNPSDRDKVNIWNKVKNEYGA